MENIGKWLKEIRKGSVKLSLLYIVSEKDSYGYEIIQKIEDRTGGMLKLAESNVYPALHKLESDGLIESFWKDVEQGIPPRKYYRITEKGKTHLNTLLDEWEKFTSGLNKLLKKEK